VNVDIDTATARGSPAWHIPRTAAILKSTEGGVVRIAKSYTEHVGMEICGKTVGLVGLGAVGGEVARRVKAFGCRVVVFDPYVAAARATELGVEMVSVKALPPSSSVASSWRGSTASTSAPTGLRRACR